MSGPTKAERLIAISTDAELIRQTAEELDATADLAWTGAANCKGPTISDRRTLRLRVEQLRRILDHADRELRHLEGEEL